MMNKDDFRILPLFRDKDAILLLVLSGAILLTVLATLAFLPDAAWDRLTERSTALYAALAALAPVLLAAYSRYKLREKSVQSLANASYMIPNGDDNA